MKQNRYSRRSNEIVREKLASILLFEISDPELQMLTVTGVETSLDRSLVRVYVSAEPSRYEVLSAALARAKGRIRSLLGHALNWRVTPDIEFKIDTTTDEAERIAKALEQVPASLAVEKDDEGYPIESADPAEPSEPGQPAEKPEAELEVELKPRADESESE